jgi:hypothetical protein
MKWNETKKAASNRRWIAHTHQQQQCSGMKRKLKMEKI